MVMLRENLSGNVSKKHGTGHMPELAPLARLSDLISQQLGVDIVRGLYAADDALPTEVTLSQQWNVSRTAVREGIRVVASKGMIETRTKAGTIVTERSRWHLLDPAVLSWMRLAEPDEAFIRSLLELRLIIEPQAAALAAKRRTAEDLSRLRKVLDIMASADRTEEAARQADIQFHRAILNAARNPALMPLADSIEAAITWSNTYKIRCGISIRESVADHERILDAIERQEDAEARWLTETLARSAINLGPITPPLGNASQDMPVQRVRAVV
jgi:DNA-binding FadR family transcriptional regulator